MSSGMLEPDVCRQVFIGNEHPQVTAEKGDLSAFVRVIYIREKVRGGLPLDIRGCARTRSCACMFLASRADLFLPANGHEVIV